MLIQPDCIPCLLKMSLAVMRKLPMEEAAVREVYYRILEIPAIRGHCWDITGPEVIEGIMEEIYRTVGDSDPFFSEKEKQNRRIMELSPVLERAIARASDPLFTAVKLAIIGNAIDFMVSEKGDRLEAFITERMDGPFPSKDYADFVRQLRQSKRILYLGDNSGEIVLDKLLMKTIQAQYDPEIHFVVRSAPTLNDATRKEAAFVGMDEVAAVMENGTAGPVPGTLVKRCSQELRDLIVKADLIISKGGGNFDTLEEEIESVERNITFMLLSKCYPYFHYFGVPEQQPILSNVFQKERHNALP